MTKNQFIKVIAAVIAAASLLCQSVFFSAAAEEERVTVMLSLEDGGDCAVMRDIISAMDSCARFMGDFKNVMRGFAVTTTLEVAARLRGFAGVRDVYVSRILEDDGESVEKAASDAVALLNEDWEYRGEGMVAAVIDTSFDVRHEMFTLTDPSAVKIKQDDVDALLEKGELSISNFVQYMDNKSPYINAKIPFAFDYCGYDFKVSDSDSHGTHVAGIIGANNRDGIKYGFDGVAPECQLILMKASYDDSDGLYEYAIMYALDDAITLGADVVNMSFSVPAGSTSHELATYDYGKLIEEASAMGVIVVCSAGNENMLGASSNYDKLYNVDMPLCENPDYGLVGSPSTYKEAFSVASVDSENVIISDYIMLSSGTIIKYWLPDIDISLDALGKTVEYVAIDGLGEAKDYENADVKGKLALVKRGVTTFIEKVNCAQDAGAIGVVVYDRDDSTTDFSMQLDATCRIPAVSVSNKDGKKMLAESVKALSFKSGGKTVFESDTGGQLSSFSSRGMTADLSLKPEISAVGGDVYSTIPGGYGIMSGTSMSSPYTAGAALLVRQMLIETGRDAENSVLVRRILMSTASTVTDSETGVEYSPRTQGAGLVDISAALKCGVTLYSTDLLTKAELGDGLGRTFSMTVALRNDTERDIEYKVAASVTSDGYEKIKCGDSYQYFITGKQNKFANATINIDGGKVNVNKYRSDKTESVTVKAGEIRNITVSVEIDRKSFSEYGKIFTNGFFAEGFVWLTPTDSDENTLSIPYAGFCGDWEAAPVFAGKVNSSEDSFYTQSAYSYFYAGGKALGYNLGKSMYIKDDTVNPDLILISPNGDSRGDYISLELFPLRNITSLTIRIESADGETVCVDSEEGFTSKSLYNGKYEDIYGYNFQYIWNGSDFFNNSYRMPDGAYTLTLTTVIEGGESESQWSMDFTVDTVKPELKEVYLTEKDGRTLLHCKVSDNYGMQYIGAYLRSSDYGESYIPAALDAEKEPEVVIDITEAAGEKYIYLDMLDFAANLATERLILADLIRK